MLVGSFNRIAEGLTILSMGNGPRYRGESFLEVEWNEMNRLRETVYNGEDGVVTSGVG